MKRIWFAGGILIAIVLLGCYALLLLQKSVETLSGELEVLASMTADSASPQTLLERTSAFEATWEEMEEQLMHFIRHDSLDDITGVVARLKALAAYGDYGELAAEIERLRHLVQHIQESEQPRWATIF